MGILAHNSDMRLVQDMNPNGRLAIYANINGQFFGRKVVDQINLLRAQNGAEEPISLKVPSVEEFPNSMIKVRLTDKVRGEDAYLIQWFPLITFDKDKCGLNATRNKEEFFHTIASLFQAGVKRLTLVTPYVYDQRKDTLEGRDTINAALFCQELSGVTHGERMQAFCLDVHAQQIVGFYQLININLVSVPMFMTFVDYIKEEYPEILDDALLILPDEGGAKRGRRFSEITGLERITVTKRRISSTETKVEFFAAKDIDIIGKTGILIDDILASGSTAGSAIEYLKSMGLSKAYWIMTHPEITDIERLDTMYDQGLFEKIFISDTIALPRDYFIHVPISKLLARLIYYVHTDQSISDYLE
jgi:ribose-phosphate pyrophosphokinase